MFQTRSKDACSTQEKDFLRSDLFFSHYILWLTASGPVGRHGPLTRCCVLRLLGTLHDRNLKQNGWRLGGGGWARPCEHSVSNINN